MCLYGKLMRNPKYRANKKNKGIVPEMKDKRVGYVPVGCGICMECLKQRANNWQVRLEEDIKHNRNGKFVTLTFTDEALEKLAEGINVTGYARENAIARKAVKYFRERWRRKTKKSPRHWFVTELGGTNTERLHLHGIVWCDDVKMGRDTRNPV